MATIEVTINVDAPDVIIEADGVRLPAVQEAALIERLVAERAVINNLLAELLTHDAHGYGRWTRGMRRRVEALIVTER